MKGLLCINKGNVYMSVAHGECSVVVTPLKKLPGRDIRINRYKAEGAVGCTCIMIMSVDKLSLIAVAPSDTCSCFTDLM